MNSPARLEVRGLRVLEGRATILDAVSFNVRAGEVLVVLGPNGSGKTTMLQAIAGLRWIASGEILVEGRRLSSFADRCTSVAFMPDEAILPEETSLGTALGLHPGDPSVAAYGLEGLLRARATEVSRGESKRACLCATLGLQRAVVLLDEPFGAFDPRQLRDLLPRFREAVQAAAAIVTVHQMRTAELVADRLLLLAGGRSIALGTLDELRARVDAPGATLDEVFSRLLDREESHALA